MAPDETRTISRPASLAPASTLTSCSMRCGSMPPSAVVSEDEPTLTTTRRAVASSSRIVISRLVVSGLVGGVVGAIPLTPAPCGGSFIGQPLVLAATAEDLRADLDLGGEVKDHRICAANRDTVAGLGAKLE